MTEKQALKEAVRRWGKTACTTFRKNALTRADKDIIRAKPKEERTREERVGLGCSFPCTVGKIVMGMFNEVQGQGDTWEECFADADRKAAAEKEQFIALRVAKGG